MLLVYVTPGQCFDPHCTVSAFPEIEIEHEITEADPVRQSSPGVHAHLTATVVDLSLTGMTMTSWGAMLWSLWLIMKSLMNSSQYLSMRKIDAHSEDRVSH